MKIRRRLAGFLLLAFILLLQLACFKTRPQTDSNGLDKAACIAQGGIWQFTVTEADGWCALPEPTATDEAASGSEACFVPAADYDWAYEDQISSSGTGGVTCNGRFVFTNRSSQAVLLVVYAAWDNNAMKSSGWESHAVAPGETWEKRVNRTLYKNGVYTFDRVEQMLVVLDTPECSGGVATQSQAAAWAERATILDELPCP